MTRMRALGTVLGMLVAAAPVAAQAHADSLSADEAAFIREAIESTRAFRSQTEAIRAGYRKLGPDFPGMGEHWVQPALIVRGELDPRRPPVLSFLDVGGEPVLVGLAFTLPLGPDDGPPEGPFGTDVWHDHSGGVDEETLLLNHPASLHSASGGYRLSMVHVWTEVENPDGILSQNNWTLPFLRAGLAAPTDADDESARGLSLSGEGRHFYAELLGRAAELTEGEERRIEEILDQSARRVEGLISDAHASGGVVDTEALRDCWRGFWREVRANVRPEVWTALSPLSEKEEGASHH
jgi:hypothetical protein